MMRNIFRTSIAIALLMLSACNQNMAEDVVYADEPVIVEEPAASPGKSSCPATVIDDGIGGTGCPTPVN